MEPLKELSRRIAESRQLMEASQAGLAESKKIAERSHKLMEESYRILDQANRPVK